MAFKVGTQVKIESPDSINTGKKGIVNLSGAGKSLVILDDSQNTTRWYSNHNLTAIKDEAQNKTGGKVEQKSYLLLVDTGAGIHEVMTKQEVEEHLEFCVKEHGLLEVLNDISVYRLADTEPVSFKTKFTVE